MNNGSGKPFPIPVVPAQNALNPLDPLEEELQFMPLPQGMSTYVAPNLPEAQQLAAQAGCVMALQAALEALRDADAVNKTQVIDLAALNPAERDMLNELLGEGEVAAQLQGAPQVQIQESVFAGLWRVITQRDGVTVADQLEIGAVPRVLVDAALADGALPRVAAGAAPADLMNAPSLLAEIDERQRQWTPGDPAHVINLTLLPLTPGDSAHLDAQIGAGRVLILSRGYGNCRIVSTRVPHTWRVTYFNHADVVLLDTLEVTAMPEVACAAAEDLAESAQRLAEVLDWVRQAH